MVRTPTYARLPHVLAAGVFAASRDVQHHSHEATELVLIKQGYCRMEAGSRASGGPGTLFVLPARVPQYQGNDGFVQNLYVVFDAPPDLFNETFRAQNVPLDDPLFSWMEDICSLHGKDPETDATLLGGLMLSCLTRINLLEEQSRQQQLLPPSLRKALGVIETHYTNPLTSDSIARAAGLSPSHMNALFRKHVGRSPMQHVADIRLTRARALLRSPYSTVTEIAAACGYEDPNYFVRCFKQRYGVPPGEWRRRRAQA